MRLLSNFLRGAAVVGLATTYACASTPSVERTEAALDLSGEWNDVDADTVANAMIAEILGSPWVLEWRASHEGKKPVIRLYGIRNKTTGYIDTKYFTKQIEAALVRSATVEVVSSLEEAADARAERQDQAIHASDESAKSEQNELGADFVLNGWLLSDDDSAGGKTVRAYLTSIEVIDVTTQRKAWMGQKRIKKLITQ